MITGILAFMIGFTAMYWANKDNGDDEDDN